MARKIYSIDEITEICGHFYCASTLQSGFDYNNGYNCNHPDSREGETDETTGEYIGYCLCSNCPLGEEADQEDFDNPEIDNNGWTEWLSREFLVFDEATP